MRVGNYSVKLVRKRCAFITKHLFSATFVLGTTCFGFKHRLTSFDACMEAWHNVCSHLTYLGAGTSQAHKEDNRLDSDQLTRWSRD